MSVRESARAEGWTMGRGVDGGEDEGLQMAKADASGTIRVSGMESGSICGIPTSWRLGMIRIRARSAGRLRRKRTPGVLILTIRGPETPVHRFIDFTEQEHHAPLSISGPLFLTLPTSGLHAHFTIRSDSKGLSKSMGGLSLSRSSHRS